MYEEEMASRWRGTRMGMELCRHVQAVVQNALRCCPETALRPIHVRAKPRLRSSRKRRLCPQVCVPGARNVGLSEKNAG